MVRRIAPSTKIEAAIEEVLLGGLDDTDRLSELGRLGAQLVLQRAIDEEVTAFLGRAVLDADVAGLEVHDLRTPSTGEDEDQQDGSVPSPLDRVGNDV